MPDDDQPNYTFNGDVLIYGPTLPCSAVLVRGRHALAECLSFDWVVQLHCSYCNTACCLCHFANIASLCGTMQYHFDAVVSLERTLFNGFVQLKLLSGLAHETVKIIIALPNSLLITTLTGVIERI